jgi:hypothetical protein
MKMLKLTGKPARFAACREIMTAPEGHEVRISEPRRSLDQNALLWPLLECFSEQLRWPVNETLTKLEPEEWKDILSAAFEQETVRLAEGLNGGTVMLGRRTSQFGKRRFSEFIEFIYATGAQRGVMFDRGRRAA